MIYVFERCPLASDIAEARKYLYHNFANLGCRFYPVPRALKESRSVTEKTVQTRGRRRGAKPIGSTA
jgi:hypothetical protein